MERLLIFLAVLVVIVVGAIVAALALWAAVVGSATAVWAGLRHRLIRLRYADWDRELDDLAGNGRANNNA